MALPLSMGVASVIVCFILASELLAHFFQHRYVGRLLAYGRGGYFLLSALGTLVSLVFILNTLVFWVVSGSLLYYSMVLFTPARRLKARFSKTASAAVSTFQVFQLNVNFLNDKKRAVIEYLEHGEAELIFLQETNAGWLEALQLSQLPNRYQLAIAYEAGEPTYGRVILSQFPIVEGSVMTFAQKSTDCLKLDVLIHGERVTVYNIHPEVSINPKKFKQQEEDWAVLIQHIEQQKPPLLLCGDFNLTPWHSLFKGFKQQFALTDAQSLFGYQFTFPVGLRWPTLLPIDNCLVSEPLRILKSQSGPALGSDHRSLLITIGLYHFQ